MSLNQIKRKITSIKSTGKITNAMCLIATTKLKKQRELFDNVKDYFYDFYKIIHILSRQGIKIDQYNIENNEPNTLFINVNSTMGLCGSYNTTLNSFVLKSLKPNDLILQVGKQGKEFLINEKIPNEIVKYYNFVDNKTPYNVCLNIANLVLNLVKEKKVNKVVINYMKFINALTFKPTAVQIFPIEKELFDNNFIVDETVEYEFNPSQQEILEKLIPDYIATTLYGSFIEAKVSEYASRRNAMDIATKNSKELGEKYLLEYNNKRQAIITNEIIEIVSGTINKKNSTNINVADVIDYKNEILIKEVISSNEEICKKPSKSILNSKKQKETFIEDKNITKEEKQKKSQNTVKQDEIINIDLNKKIISKYSEEEIAKRESQVLIATDESEVNDNEPKTIMISLNKKYIENIINNEKEVIFLKRLPVQLVNRVLIYSTKPIGKVIGEFDLKSTQRLSKQKAWDNYGHQSILAKKEFNEYFKTTKDVKLLEIEGFILYKKPKKLEQYKMTKGPSGFTYLK